MKKIKFTLAKRAVENDYKPVKWPPKYPFWCIGEDDEKYTMVCYEDSAASMRMMWPHSTIVEVESAWTIKFTEELPKPSWYMEPVKKSSNLKESFLDTDMIDLIMNIFKTETVIVTEENNDYVVRFSDTDEEIEDNLTEAVKNLPEANRYSSCTVNDVISYLNEKDGIFYLKFLNYLKDNGKIYKC